MAVIRDKCEALAGSLRKGSQTEKVGELSHKVADFSILGVINICSYIGGGGRLF